MKKINNNVKGFTLIEIISTVIILSIILLIAIPTFSRILAGFRKDYYSKLQDTVQKVGKDYINDNRRLRPVGVFQTRIIKVPVLVQAKKMDALIDYKKKPCSTDSYIVAVKTADKKFEYTSCLTCSEDQYQTDVNDYKYCHPAWLTNDNIFVEMSPPPADIYIPLNASIDYIKSKLGITKSIVKKDSTGKIIASLPVDDKDIIYPNNINSFIGTTAQDGVAFYQYGSQTIQTNVHIYQNSAPKLSFVNVKNGTDYVPGTWSSAVRLTIEANDQYFGILNLTIKEYQYMDESGVWKKIDNCTAGLKSCTFTYNETMNSSMKFRIINNGDAASKETSFYSVRVDASTPNCYMSMLDASGAAYSGNYINTSSIRVNYKADDPQYAGLPASSIQNVELYINGVLTDTHNLNGTNVYTWTTIKTITNEGSYSAMLKCYDTVGNFSTANGTINILRDIDVQFYSPSSTTLFQTLSYQYNKAMASLPTPSRTGYTFNGWFDTPASAGTQYLATTVLDTTIEPLKLFSRWTANIYNISYVYNGGTTVSNPSSYVFATGVAGFASPSRTGYIFGGWYKEASLVTRVTSISTTDYGNYTLYAKWTPITYTMTYNANGGAGTMASTVCTYDTVCTLRTNTFTKTGTSFIGWANSTTGAVVYANGDTINNLTTTNGASFTLYAKWQNNTYGITYSLGGGTHSGNPTFYTYGTGTASFANASRTGYIFGGWYSDSALTVRVTSISTTATGDITLYAKWTAITYTIAYAANGGSGAMSNTTCTYGVGCVLRSNAFTQTGYRFTLWSYGGSNYNDGATVTNLTTTNGAVLTFTANWVQRVNYIYLLHGFSGGTSNLYGFGTQSINMNANAPYYLDTAGYVDATAQANGYSLATYVYPAAGWTWSTRTLISGLAPNKYNGVYFTAPETQEYRVTSYMFPNGGTRLGTVTWSGSTLYQDQTFQQGSIWKTVDTGTNITVPAVAAARTGYSFTGWLGENGTIYNASNVVGMTAALAGTDLNFVFRAQWLGNPYTVSFNANGGTGTMAALNCRIGQTCTLPAEAYTNNCYKFDGWATSAAGAVVYSDRATVALTANVTLYAKWSANYVNNTTTCAACSVSCGGGTQTCTVTKKDTATGVACPASLNTSYSQACNTQSCCSSVTTSYGAWGACSASCGGGTQTRSVTTKSTYNGATCSTSTQSQACNTQTCLVEPNATIYAQQLTTCVNGVYFYTTQAQNPSRWITTEMTVHWVISGAVVATYYGDLAGTNPGGFGPWYAYNFGAPPPAPATTSGYYVTRHTELYFRLKGKIATTGAAIINQSGYGGCSV